MEIVEMYCMHNYDVCSNDCDGVCICYEFCLGRGGMSEFYMWWVGWKLPLWRITVLNWCSVDVVSEGCASFVFLVVVCNELSLSSPA